MDLNCFDNTCTYTHTHLHFSFFFEQTKDTNMNVKINKSRYCAVHSGESTCLLASSWNVLNEVPHSEV